MYEKLRRWLGKKSVPEQSGHTQSSRANDLIEEGRILYDTDRFREGIQVLARATFEAPSSALAFKLYAGCLMRADRVAEAATAAKRARLLSETPDEGVMQLLGAATAQLGELEESRRIFQDLTTAFPENPANWVNLEVICTQLGDMDGVTEAFDGELIALAAQGASEAQIAARQIAISRTYRDRPQPVDTARRIIAMRTPEADIDSYEAAAAVLFNAGLIAEAHCAYEHVLSLSPERLSAQLGLGFILLIEGNDIQKGWELTQARYLTRASEYLMPPVHLTKDRSSTLHVYSEQGLGDVIMFARFLPMLKARADKLIFHVQPALAPLFTTNPHIDRLEAHPYAPTAVGATDDWLPLLATPMALGLNRQDYKFTKPYLSVPEERRRQWGEWVNALPKGPRIGLVWAGNRAREDDSFRSIFPDVLTPLGALETVQWVRLQMDARPEYLTAPFPFPLHDPTAMIRDMADTAAIIENLDMVISIDTGVAHLASAFDVPCWVLLPRMLDWRWVMGDDSSPWYRSTRLFRVQDDKQWAPVIARMREDIVRWLAQRNG